MSLDHESSLDKSRQHEPTLYLGSCDAIDIDSPEIKRVAATLHANDPVETARRCFEFARDEIKHTSDHQSGPITCRASDVLRYRTGYCYAKSHLLCAMLRANQIPAGLCYQRLSDEDVIRSYCIHGLVAVNLPTTGWYRIDARGNRDGIDAQFDPPHERLAFSHDGDGECLFPDIHRSPLPEVVECLTRWRTWEDVNRNLPDRPPIN